MTGPPLDPIGDRLSLPPFNLPDAPAKPDPAAPDAEHDRYKVELERWLHEVRRVDRMLSVERDGTLAAQRAAEQRLFDSANRGGVTR